MQIKEIYKKYQILPMLQEHLIRVAYVGESIAKNIPQIPNPNNIIIACLLHDLGNIIKFNFSAIPEATKPEGIDYWEKVKKDFINKYGEDEVLATHKILEELKVSYQIKELVYSFGTRNVNEVIKSGDIEKMIVNYSDHRVSPYAVESLKARIEDQHQRILKSMPKEEAQLKIAQRNESDEAKYILESEIFKLCKIKPEDITDPNIKELEDRYLQIELK